MFTRISIPKENPDDAVHFEQALENYRNRTNNRINIHINSKVENEHSIEYEFTYSHINQLLWIGKEWGKFRADHIN